MITGKLQLQPSQLNLSVIRVTGIEKLSVGYNYWVDVELVEFAAKQHSLLGSTAILLVKSNDIKIIYVYGVVTAYRAVKSIKPVIYRVYLTSWLEARKNSIMNQFYPQLSVDKLITQLAYAHGITDVELDLQRNFPCENYIQHQTSLFTFIQDLITRHRLYYYFKFKQQAPASAIWYISDDWTRMAEPQPMLLDMNSVISCRQTQADTLSVSVRTHERQHYLAQTILVENNAYIIYSIQHWLTAEHHYSNQLELLPILKSPTQHRTSISPLLGTSNRQVYINHLAEEKNTSWLGVSEDSSVNLFEWGASYHASCEQQLIKMSKKLSQSVNTESQYLSLHPQQGIHLHSDQNLEVDTTGQYVKTVANASHTIQQQYQFYCDQGQYVLQSSQSLELQTKQTASIQLSEKRIDFNASKITLSTADLCREQILRVGDTHVCSQVNADETPHVGGQVESKNKLLFNQQQPIALCNDVAHCSQSQATINSGNNRITVNQIPVATLASTTTHMSQFTQASSTLYCAPQAYQLSQVHRKKALRIQFHYQFADIKYRFQRPRHALPRQLVDTHINEQNLTRAITSRSDFYYSIAHSERFTWLPLLSDKAYQQKLIAHTFTLDENRE
jgi:uncharacterized Zn-binding protein involved in type VI secretion